MSTIIWQQYDERYIEYKKKKMINKTHIDYSYFGINCAPKIDHYINMKSINISHNKIRRVVFRILFTR